MPRDFEPREIAESGDFSMQARETQVGEVQANVTFRVTSVGERPLGHGGELSGISKLDPREALQHVEDARDRAHEEAMTRLGEIAQEIQQRLDTDNTLDDTLRTRLERQRGFIQQKLQSQNRTFVQMDLGGVPDYMTDPTLVKATALHRQVVNQGLNENLYQSLGIEPGQERGTAMLTRAVATSKLDQMLGTNVIAEERFGVDEQGRSVGISVRVDGVGVVGSLPGGRDCQLETDYTRHEVQKGLYDLEVIDYITGQIDRHPGNIFIDPETGEVKGIDNDMCLPGMSRDTMLGQLDQEQGKPVYNKPLFMHEDTAKKIEGLSPERLRRTLRELKYPGDENRGRLTPEEIEGAVTRLQELKEHVRELRRTGHVVTEFNQQTYNEAIAHQKASYEAQHPNAQGNARTLDTLESPGLLDVTHKTSYIGSIYCEQRRTDIAIQQEAPRERLDIEGIRRETNSTGKSTRSPEHTELARLEKIRRNELRPNETAPQQQDLERLNQRVARMERRLERLERPNLWERIKSIWHGGVEGAKDVFRGKRFEALQEIDERKRIIEDNINLTIDQERGARWNQAKQNVQNARLQQEQGQNLGLNQSQKVDTNLGEEVDGRFMLNPQKLGMVDTSPNKPGFVLNELNEPEIGVDEDAKAELQKQGSVRDLLKSRDGNKEPKVKSELEVEDDTVRSQVGVKKTESTTQKGYSNRV